MPDFLLLLNEIPAHRRFVGEQAKQIADSYVGWMRRLAADGVLIAGDKLTLDGGRVVDGDGDEVTVTDGPFPETKEVLGGYLKITAADYAGAVEIARSCPHIGHGGVIQVRQVLGTANDHLEELSE